MEDVYQPYAWLRLGTVGLAWVAIALLFRRQAPRPVSLAFVSVALGLASWAAWTWPLGRSYGLFVQSDRAFNLGMAACAAAGASPFEHTQVGFRSLEPFWNWLVAALAGFHPERVPGVYEWLSPVALLALALGAWWSAAPERGDEPRAWEPALAVLAVLGLASSSLTQHGPLPPFWITSVLLKPNHTMAFGLVGAALALRARGRTLLFGLALGALAWLFILTWAYVLAALVLAALFERDRRRALREALLAGLLSALIAMPYVLYLARDNTPGASGHAARLWDDPLAALLAHPYWVTLDLGVLLPLALLGAWAALERRSSSDCGVLGLVAGGWSLWLAHAVGSRWDLAPEPDEAHYFLRFALGVAAGLGLARVARACAAWRGRGLARGALLVAAAAMPLTLQASWDPPTMDQYYRIHLPGLKPSIVEYATWVREHTPRGSVFAAEPAPSTWIPVFAGRQVLLAGDARPPADYVQRRADQQTLFLSEDAASVRAAARRWRVSYVVRDHGAGGAASALDTRPFYRLAFRNAAASIYELQPEQ